MEQSQSKRWSQTADDLTFSVKFETSVYSDVLLLKKEAEVTRSNQKQPLVAIK